MSFNSWVNQGTVITDAAGFSPGQPTVFFEGGSQLGLGAGNIFKMWYNNVSNPFGIYYAESTDGLTWTQDPGNPIIASIGGGVKVFKNGSTYYLYAGPGSFSGAFISAYTSSDGVTWTLQNANALLPGAIGEWDHISVYQLAVAGVESGVWWGYYTASQVGIGQGFPMGLATSVDGINWTKTGQVASLSSGVMKDGSPWLGSGNFTVHSINGAYYAWSQTTLTNYPNYNAAFSLPSDIMRWSAPAINGPWTALGSLTYYRTLASEGMTTGAAGKPWLGQVADPSMVSDGTNLWLFYTALPDGTNEINVGFINAAKAANTTFTQLVATSEGIQNIPIPYPGGATSKNFSVLASDLGIGINANPIGGNWTPENTTAPYGPAQRLSNLIEPGSLTQFASDSFWNAFSWAADQWSQTVIHTVAGSLDFIGANVRMNVSNVNTNYRSIFSGLLGSPGSVFIQRQVNAVTTNLLSFQSINGDAVTVSQGDSLALIVVGTTLCLYWNGYLLGIVTDANIASGAAGFILQSNTALADCQISSWSGGNFQSAAATTYTITGNVGIAGATVTWSGTTSGSTTADGSGNYTIPSLINGPYTITPSLAGHIFSPVSSIQTVSGADIAGVNFTAGLAVYSVPDCRVSPSGPNASRTVQGTKIYDVQTSSNATVPSKDSRVAGAPVDSRVVPNIPQNSRTPGTFGPGNN